MSLSHPGGQRPRAHLLTSETLPTGEPMQPALCHLESTGHGHSRAFCPGPRAARQRPLQAPPPAPLGPITLPAGPSCSVHPGTRSHRAHTGGSSVSVLNKQVATAEGMASLEVTPSQVGLAQSDLLGTGPLQSPHTSSLQGSPQHSRPPLWTPTLRPLRRETPPGRLQGREDSCSDGLHCGHAADPLAPPRK